MKRLMLTVATIGLAASFAGCASEPNDLDESTVTSAVTENAWNFVLSCTPLALRSCDNYNGCDTGVRMPFGTKVFVGQVDWGTRVAHLTSPSGWARADGTDGDPYLSANLSSACK